MRAPFTASALGLLLALACAGPAAAAPVATEFSAGISPAANPENITAGPDGNLWFTESHIDRIGRITPFGNVTEFSAGITAGANPESIVAGPDGNLWFTENAGNRIGRISPTGTVTEFTTGISPGAFPEGIAAGPDGNLWFTEPFVGGVGGIGRITPAGLVTEFKDSISPDASTESIVAGPDGNLWFTERTGDNIGRVTPSGVVTEFPTPSGAASEGLTAGPDGNLWFTERAANRIGRITTSGVVTEFSAGLSSGAAPRGITTGPDGDLWFTERDTGKIGRITPSGTITEFSAGISPGAGPFGIVAGPDGNVWFTTRAGNLIGRMATNAAAPASGNLLRNPGFEDGTPIAIPGGLAPVLGWVTVPSAAAIAYGADPTLPGTALSAVVGGGGAYLFGGTRQAHSGEPGTSKALQLVDVSSVAAAIDDGRVSVNLSGSIGGRLSEADQGSLAATFVDGGGGALGSLTIAPVTAAARGYQTTLVPRTARGRVPPRTRAIRVVATADKESGGAANDAYFDNLQLTLDVAPPTALLPPSPVPDTPALPGEGTPAAVVVRPYSKLDPVRAAHSPRRFSGTAGAPAGHVVRTVELAIVRAAGTASVASVQPARCWRVGGTGRLIAVKPARIAKKPACVATGFLRATGTARWTFTLRRPLPKGRYVVTSRATDTTGTRETTVSKANRRAFTVH